MKSSGKDCMGVVCSLYGFSVLAVLPLYMKEGYWQIGDAKYEMFQNIAIICLLVGGIAGFFCCIGIFVEWWSARSSFEKTSIITRCRFSWTDTFITAYAAVNVLSFWGSAYRETAWTGFYQWNMGLFTQLLLVGSYFLFSRGYNGTLFFLRCGQAALFLVALLGILNRLRIDPLRLFEGMNSLNWDYNHLLSTIGNINWLTGYLCVAVPLAAAEYLRASGLGLQIFLYVTSLAGLFLLVIQGSDSGLAAAGLAIVILYAIGMDSVDRIRRLLLLTAGLCTAFVLMSAGITARESWDTFPYDDKSRYLMGWHGWIPVVILLAAVYFLSFYLPFEKIRQAMRTGGICLAGFLVVGGIWYLGASSRIDYAWGSGRGGLWAMALRAFCEGDFKQKLIGAGPDCYAQYLYANLPVKNYLVQKGHFENSIFANAHNEWLNQLVNTGILGVASYGGIFVSALLRFGKRCRKDFWLGIAFLALWLYGINSLVSFQQVMNTAPLFLLLGIGESRIRKEAVE